jgi:tellurite resistance protein TerC
VRITPQLHGERFFVQLPHPKTQLLVWYLTPLMIALIMIELADIMFAIDSIPAVFTISQDPFVIYTSNLFAILGLRALYFSLATVLGRFYYLKTSLAVVLIFIGSKAFIVDAMGLEKFPAGISLGVTIALLSLGVFFSLLRDIKNR